MGLFDNKVVVITGAGSGIGRETSIEFSKEGAVVILADKNADFLQAALVAIEKEGGQSFGMQIDVSQDEECFHLIEKVNQQYGQIDVLFNNAGIEISGPFLDCSEKDFDQLIENNLKSIFFCSKYTAKKMIIQKYGVIVNTASVAALVPWPQDTIYSVSKAGVAMLTKGMAAELACHNIRVNAVAPGIIDTPMTDRALSNYKNIVEAKKEKAKLHPLNRLGMPYEVARTVLFLSSEQASFITGAILPIDGGYLVR